MLGGYNLFRFIPFNLSTFVWRVLSGFGGFEETTIGEALVLHATSSPWILDELAFQ